MCTSYRRANGSDTNRKPTTLRYGKLVLALIEKRLLCQAMYLLRGIGDTFYRRVDGQDAGRKPTTLRYGKFAQEHSQNPPNSQTMCLLPSIWLCLLRTGGEIGGTSYRRANGSDSGRRLTTLRYCNFVEEHSTEPTYFTTQVPTSFDTASPTQDGQGDR